MRHFERTREGKDLFATIRSSIKKVYCGIHQKYNRRFAVQQDFVLSTMSLKLDSGNNRPAMYSQYINTCVYVYQVFICKQHHSKNTKSTRQRGRDILWLIV